MKYEISEKEGVVVVTPKGRMMAGPELEKLHEKIKELVRIGARKMVIDLGDVELMDSRGLGILVAALTSLKNVQGELKLARITNKIESLLVITQLSKVFKTYDSVEGALKSF
ncbi:MAG: STAS domain-containing protein [candidate division Zixibacteria bacterium]|nr:STAS domain-containing protein [candidate division Zixibacteria bacterium]MCI0595303.1 STAS domain-containing protein [candidate division Zixibacteria bacterium]